MRLIIDTEMEKVIVPDTFYKQIDKMNEVLIKNGAEDKKINYEDYVKGAVEKALANPYIRKSDVASYKK